MVERGLPASELRNVVRGIQRLWSGENQRSAFHGVA
jgi:hypothetical protein